MTEKKPRLTLLTGQSGAGLTTAINALADAGFYCIDNLPYQMIIPTLKQLMNDKFLDGFSGLAFGFRINDLNIIDSFEKIKKALSEESLLDVVFLSASDEILLKRYSSTRRPHPLILAGKTLKESVEVEKKCLHPVKNNSDYVLDTSSLSPHELVRIFEKRYSDEAGMRRLKVTISSFGFKHGQYRPADSVFDVRFLKNPYFVPKLSKKTGLESDVRDYIMQDEKSKELLKRLIDWHEWVLPKYYDEGKHYFRIAIGCTGGKHRSVCMTELLAVALNEMQLPCIEVTAHHRDLLLP